MKKIFLSLLASILTFTGIKADNKPVASSPAPEWLADAVIYEVNLRQGTADRNLKAMQLELPRLKNLGVDVVWLMPVHPISELNRKGTLGSYYAVKDYKDVNPEFGSIQDLREFVQTAHHLGMKVILDEVCNHSGCDNAWVAQHPDFYALNEQGEMYGPFDWTDTYKLDYSNPEMRKAMIDALEFWVRDIDIDGYRCDVAMEVPTDFWEEAREKLQAIKPVMMLAEASKPELLNKAFDVDYAWPMKDLFNAIAATGGENNYAVAHNQTLPEKKAKDIMALLAKLEKDYPQGALHMNMVTNHDLNSWEGTEFERYGKGLGAFAVLSYTLPGVPMLYTGQEVGFNHAFEFFENDSIHPDYSANEFTAFYHLLNSLKHNNPAMRAGDKDVKFTYLPTTNDNIICFSRKKGDNEVIVMANLSPETVPVKFRRHAPKLNDMHNIFTSEMVDTLPGKLQGWQYIVLSTR